MFLGKILIFFNADPLGKNSHPGWEKAGSRIKIPNPQHFLCMLTPPLPGSGKLTEILSFRFQGETLQF
jgi:hypothetical protein